MFDRKELLKSKEYWLTKIQLKFYSLFYSYMADKNINKTQLARELGVSKGYVSQILNGDFDHRLSKFVELSLSLEKVPRVYFEDMEQVYDEDEKGMLYEDQDKKMININRSYRDSTKEKFDCFSNKRVSFKKQDDSPYYYLGDRSEAIDEEKELEAEIN